MAHTTTIWRVEMADGSSPFVDGTLDGFIDKFCDSELYPSPQNDYKIRRFPEDNELCGCRTLEGLVYWFGDKPVLKQLARHGAVIQKIEVSRKQVEFGEKQVLFERDAAVVLETHAIENLHKLAEATSV